jgi:HD-like signal output (HDOD) protein
VQIEMRNEKLASIPWAHLRLPPFPQVAIRILQLANNENVQLHQLCDLIATDPAFAGEVLTIANSLLYAPRFPASTIMQAVSVLGANHLQGMCLTVGVRAYLGKTLSLPAMRDLWRHNLACALIADQLAAMGPIDKAIAYSSGILHDIGRFALGVIQPKEYSTMLTTHCGTAVSMLERERELFGWNHCEAGIHLIASWKLPSGFDPIVSEHHEPRPGSASWGMEDLIKVSCRMADAAGFPAFRGCEITPYPELLCELPAHERRLFHANAESLSGEVSNSIHAIECA